ncbi:MAG TPA: amino acid ABC transporter permease [Thermoprotei archaeon]|nr:amino acid ABC transporter permease [Thermoprotei archaeon]
MDLEFFVSILPYLLEGIKITLEVSLTSFIIGFIISSIITPTRIFLKIPFTLPADSYVELIRGTPVLVQLFIIYFGLPSIGIYFDPLWAGIIALGINSGAYQAEIFRSSIKSIPESQYLAAESLGMSNLQIYRYVIFPQAVRIAIPALINELVTLVKESSLVSIIGVTDLMRRGEYIVASTFKAFEVYIVVAIVYFLICYTLSFISRKIEKILKIPGYERS